MPIFGAAFAGLLAGALVAFSWIFPSRFGQFAWVICVTILICVLIIIRQMVRWRRNRYMGHPERYKMKAQHKA